MKYLKEYNSNSDYDDVKQTLNDILLEIEDEGVKCKFGDISSTTRQKTQAYTISIDVNAKLTDREKRSGFLDLPEWFIESLARVEDYMKSNGFKTDYYIKLPSEWQMVVDLEELAECNSLVFTIFILTYNSDENPFTSIFGVRAASNPYR
jgi:hypothetical protein